MGRRTTAEWDQSGAKRRRATHSRNLMKPPAVIVGNTGLYYVCHRLSALGWNVLPTARNGKMQA